MGVDLSAAAVEAAERRRLPGPASWSVTSWRSTSGFDVVVLNEMLYYVADSAAFLGRLGELLAPSGLMLLSMWRHPGDRAFWRDQSTGGSPSVDRVEARNRANPLNPRGWIVAYCRRYRSAVDLACRP